MAAEIAILRIIGGVIEKESSLLGTSESTSCEPFAIDVWTRSIGGLTLYSMNTSTVTPARGVGASHQTGWSGAIARIMHRFAFSDSQKILEQSK
jgi:hypothetical protein